VDGLTDFVEFRQSSTDGLHRDNDHGRRPAEDHDAVRSLERRQQPPVFIQHNVAIAECGVRYNGKIQSFFEAGHDIKQLVGASPQSGLEQRGNKHDDNEHPYNQRPLHNCGQVSGSSASRIKPAQSYRSAYCMNNDGQDHQDGSDQNLRQHSSNFDGESDDD